MTEILLLEIALLLAVLAAGLVGITAILTLACLTALVVVPRATVSIDVIGVEQSIAVLCVLLLTPLLAVVRPRTSLPWLFGPLALFLLVMSIAGWTGSETWDGTSQILLAVAAWGIGSMLASLHGDRLRLDRWLAICLLGVVAFQTVVTGVQTLGVDVFTASSAAAEFTEGRASGSFGHPGNLGKAIVLIVLIVLPLTRATDLVTSRAATFAAVLSLVPVGLSQSRSNIAALVGVLVLWAALTPRAVRRGPRLFVPLLVGAIGIMLAGPILDRFRLDPAGGAREHLLEVALAHIPEHLWLGVGPGSYVEAFGRYDLLTSQGWPVHNAFLLLLAEIGLLGLLLLLVPIVVSVVRAIRRLRAGDRRSNWARATLAAVPALLVLAVTGWGLASGTMLALWLLTFGYLTRRAVDDRPEVDDTVRGPASGFRIGRGHATYRVTAHRVAVDR